MSSDPAAVPVPCAGAAPKEGTDIRIAISGKSGCGNSTVSRIVAKRLGLRVVNYTFKDLARERGMSFEEVCRLAEQDSQYDFTIDKMQVSLAQEGRCVLGSRLAIWLLRGTALTVYLEAGLEARAARISRREGIPLDLAREDTYRRDTRDHDRYKRLYGYDVDDYAFADLVIDAEAFDQEAVADLIVRRAGKGSPAWESPPRGT
jgi:cytidylate kinase